MSLTELGVLVLGVVAALQDLTPMGEKSRKAAGMLFGFALAVYMLAESQGLIAGPALLWIDVVIQALALVLAVFGYVTLATRAGTATVRALRR